MTSKYRGTRGYSQNEVGTQVRTTLVCQDIAGRESLPMGIASFTLCARLSRSYRVHPLSLFFSTHDLSSLHYNLAKKTASGGQVTLLQT